jgi:hypothetical protein
MFSGQDGVLVATALCKTMLCRLRRVASSGAVQGSCLCLRTSCVGGASAARLFLHLGYVFKVWMGYCFEKLSSDRAAWVDCGADDCR